MTDEIKVRGLVDRRVKTGPKWDIVFAPQQFTYDFRKLQQRSPDPAADMLVLTIAFTGRAYGGANKDWTDFPMNWWKEVLGIGFPRIKESVLRLVEIGMLEVQNMGQPGATPRLYYRNRGETKEEYALPAFAEEDQQELDAELAEVVVRPLKPHKEPVITPEEDEVISRTPGSFKPSMEMGTAVDRTSKTGRKPKAVPLTVSQVPEGAIGPKAPFFPYVQAIASGMPSKEWGRAMTSYYANEKTTYLNYEFEVKSGFNVEHFVNWNELADLKKGVKMLVGMDGDEPQYDWYPWTNYYGGNLDYNKVTQRKLVKCARCNRNLADGTYNSDKICLICQKELQ